jgi:hypothetical protein
MKSLRQHLSAEEVAVYTSRGLDFRARPDIEEHAAVCEQCFHTLMDGIWDSLEAAAAHVAQPAEVRLVRAW